MSGGQSKTFNLPGLSLALAPFVLLFLALMYGGALIQPPPVRMSNAVEQFDATAARARLERIIGEGAPHPIDSAAQDAVRERLLRELAALGIAPSVRESFVCRPQPRGPLIDCALVRNIVFSVGPAGGPSVLVASHYDSVPAGAGASDDGVGVAASLEIARVLMREPLRRRVLFLISDGEEQALLGAYAFAREDSLMTDVEALVNLEARGTRGPAMFFETNQPNGDAYIAFSGAPRPLANSVMADIYALMPNSTDVTAMTKPGLDVINLALLDGFENYHTPQDSLASFNTASLQHIGDVGLHAVRGFARTPDLGAETRFVYTDIASRVLVSAPSWAAQAVLGVSALIAFIVFWRCGANARWRSLALPIVALVFASGVAWAGGAALAALRSGEDYWFAYPELTRAWCALSGLLGLALAFAALGARHEPDRVGAAGFFWFALTGLVASFSLSGVSILFAAPALVFVIGAVLGLAWKRALQLGGALAALLALAIFAPMFSLVELALGFAVPAAFAALATILGWTWAGLIAAAQRGGERRIAVLAVSVAALVVSMVAASQAPAASQARPLPLNITYFVDTTAGQARVLAGPARRALPAALREHFAFRAETILPGDSGPTWAAPAPLQSAPTPTLEAITISDVAGERVLRARLAMNGAYRAVLRLPRSAAPIRAAINGAGAAFADTGGQRSDFVSLACQGRACDGAAVEVVLAADGQAGDWRLIGITPGVLAPAAEPVRAARPSVNTSIQTGDGALTLSRFRPGW